MCWAPWGWVPNLIIPWNYIAGADSIPVGNLGEKMWNLASKNSSPFLIIGSDIPNINLNSISCAFKKLKTNDIVIGPTYDGGFWLIGFSCKRKIIFPFKNVQWSSKYTLTDLTTNLKSRNAFLYLAKLKLALPRR